MQKLFRVGSGGNLSGGGGGEEGPLGTALEDIQQKVVNWKSSGAGVLDQSKDLLSSSDAIDSGDTPEVNLMTLAQKISYMLGQLSKSKNIPMDEQQTLKNLSMVMLKHNIYLPSMLSISNLQSSDGNAANGEPQEGVKGRRRGKGPRTSLIGSATELKFLREKNQGVKKAETRKSQDDSRIMFGQSALEDLGVDRELVSWLQKDYNLLEEQRGGTGLKTGPGLGKRAKRGRRKSSIQSKLTGSPKVDAVLQKHKDWDFDVFSLDKVTKKKPLSTMGLKVLYDSGLTEAFTFSESTLLNFLDRIEAGYNDVPYHNAVHAADVLQACHFYIHRGLMRKWMTDLEVLALYLACICHDYKHPGVNSNFLINRGDPLAVRYNDRSVLESFHVAESFAVIQSMNLLEHFSREDQTELRKLMIDCVLATDMTGHFKHVSEFQSKVDIGFDFEKASDRMVIFQMCIKCADISNAARPQELNLNWTSRVMEEFFMQGDREKKEGLPISPLCGRHGTNIPKSQIGFMDFIVKPMFTAFCKFMPIFEEMCMPSLQKNRKYWSDKIPPEEAEQEK